MRIIYENLWDNYALVESQEDTSYPAENTQDIRIAKTWRTQTASAATIYIDSGSSITCNCAAVIGHNFTLSAGIAVQAATASTFASVLMSANLSYRSDVMLVFFTADTHRYWRFSLSDTTASCYEMGRLMLGTYLQVDPSSLVEFPESHVRSDRQAFSVANQLYSDKGIGHKEYRYSFENTGNTMKAAMQTMWETVGMYKPILFMNYDTSYTVIPPVYCVIGEDMSFTHLKYDKWKYDLVLREVD